MQMGRWFGYRPSLGLKKIRALVVMLAIAAQG